MLMKEEKENYTCPESQMMELKLEDVIAASFTAASSTPGSYDDGGDLTDYLP